MFAIFSQRLPLSSTISPLREMAIFYYCFAVQVLYNLVVLIVATVIVGAVVVAKHIENVSDLFGSTPREMDEGTFKRTVEYHVKILDFVNFYNSGVETVFTFFFVLQLILTAVILYAVLVVC